MHPAPGARRLQLPAVAALLHEHVERRVVVPDREAGRQQPQHEEGLRGGLVLDVVRDRVGEEVLDLRWVGGWVVVSWEVNNTVE